MNLKQSFRLTAFPALYATVFIGISACGGGGSTSPASSSAPAAGDQQAPAKPVAAPPSLPDASQPALTMPSNIANGSVVELQCGRYYQGTLDLKGKSNVTVKTAGSCGKAVITPAQPISGWVQHQGNIFSAPISFDAAQVLVDAQPVSQAHWPSKAQTWARATGSSAGSLSYPMPNGDLAGATLVFKPYEWAIEARRITGYSGGTMSLAATGNMAYDGYALSGTPDFYVEGKLWMLDEPGEWAVSGGRLYLWASDGKSPEGRVWAAPNRHGIDASNSADITIDGVSVFGAANGIHALDAARLRVANVDITNSSEHGIENSGGSALAVDAAAIRNSRHDAISVHWGGGGESIRNSSIDASGVIGMPTNARSAINLTVSSGASVVNNSVTNSGYIGIRVFRDATVAHNSVHTACTVLTDCGGIFTSARDKLALNTRIEGNLIENVGPTQRLVWALYLGDHANGVTVANNTVAGNGNGMNVFDGFNNVIKGNSFTRSTQAHIQMAESGTTASVRNNVVTDNTFVSKNGEETYRISSDLGTASVAQFGSYDRNTYLNASAVFANFNGEPLTFEQWKARTGQDGASTSRAP